MFEKTNEIINNSTPDRFLYEVWGLEKSCSGFYQPDGMGCIDPFTYDDCFETAKEASDALFSGEIDDDDYIESKTGLRCDRYALHKMTDEILEEFKNSILENEFIYEQEMYDEKLSWAKEHSFFPEYPELGEKAFPYWYPTEDFVKSWDHKDLLKYCEYNHRFYVGNSCLCKIGDYKNFILLYDCTDDNYYFGSSKYDQLEDYTPAEDIDNDDDSDDDE